jgi:predicted nucleic acid-binding protein
MGRLVVADTGPLIHLEQADALSLLELTGEILVPKTVLDELAAGPTNVSKLDFSVEQVDIDSAYPNLDPGETAALLVCTDRDAILLTDDMDARSTANEEGIEVHGSVGVVLYGFIRIIVTVYRWFAGPSRRTTGTDLQ